jgi:hypothetical protein
MGLCGSKPGLKLIPKHGKSLRISNCSGDIKCYRHEEDRCIKPGGD